MKNNCKENGFPVTYGCLLTLFWIGVIFAAVLALIYWR